MDGERRDPRQALGRAAEDAAAAQLARAGFRVLERNVAAGPRRDRLVCRDGDIVVFVEVKCRRATWAIRRPPPCRGTSSAGSRGWRSITSSGGGWRAPRCRFDVVSVTVDAAGRSAIAHVRNAFDAVP